MINDPKILKMKFAHKLTYHLLNIFSKCLQKKSFSSRILLSRRMGSFIYYFLPIRKKLAGLNIKKAFPDRNKTFYKKSKSLESTQKYFNETKNLSSIEIKEFSFLYLIINNLVLIKNNLNLLENVKLFSKENKIIYASLIQILENEEEPSKNNLSLDPQILNKISKFASIKHILNKLEKDESKILELLKEIIRDIKNYELEIRIEELESKFSKDLNENTFNEIKELKKLQKIN